MLRYKFDRNDPAELARIAAFHPGGDPLPPVPHLSEVDRLAAAEGEMLALAVERGLNRGEGRMHDLAVLIVALRAAVAH